MEQPKSDELEGMLAFLRAAESLKATDRSGRTSAGRPESVAEHTWRLCLMAMILCGRDPGLDLLRLLKMCLIHDLGEALGGDIPAPLQTPSADKAAGERADLSRIVATLPPASREEILGLWDEYESASTREAKLAKGMDKLETILQHTQGRNPPGFDYAFNLDYGRDCTGVEPILAELRARLDRATARLAEAPEQRSA